MTALPEDWVETFLGEVSSSKQYGYTESASIEKVGPKFLRITDIQHDFIDWNVVPYCPISEKDKLKYKLDVGDIVIARTGNSTGATATIKDSNIDAVFASYLIRFKIDPQIADYNFIDFSLRSKRWKGFVKSIKGGSAQGGANANNFAEYPINLPPLPEQKAIADMLSSFDEKIELLREQNKTLETLAQTIFKAWFVNFNDPDATGDMVESELGLIPKDWRVGGIRCLVEHVKKNIKPFSYPERDYQHYSLPAFDSGKRPEKHSGSEISSNKYAVVENCFLVSKLNPTTPRIWAILNRLENSVCSTEFQVIKPNNYDSFGFVYGALTSYGLRRELSARSHGTSSSHQRVSPADILDAPVTLPSDNLIKQYSIMVNEMLEKVDHNYFQIQTLSKTRDTLLPKLMSGQVRVI